jgi:hypothetical protein
VVRSPEHATSSRSALISHTSFAQEGPVMSFG